MTIRALSRQEFDRIGSAQGTLRGLTRKAVEWFADDTGEVLDAIADHGLLSIGRMWCWRERRPARSPLCQ
jgi:hypothetical protein